MFLAPVQAREKRGSDMSTKPIWLALALLGSTAMISACEEKSPAEEAADEIGDAVDDVADEIKDATN